LNSGLCAWKSKSSKASFLQSILLWLFWRQTLEHYLPGLTLNLNPPDLTLPNS
jgi:hypothetical protein